MGNFAYSVGQGGVIQMTRELSTEWADRGVRVNAIVPAEITNPGFEERMDNTPGLRERFLRGIPASRLGLSDDIKGLVMFLASDVFELRDRLGVRAGWRQPGDGRQRHHRRAGRRETAMSENPISIPSKDQLLALYRTMLLIRRTEEQLKFTSAAQSTARATPMSARRRWRPAFAPSCARTTRLQHASRPWPCPRQGSHAAGELIAEVMGRATGCSRGRGGSMHLFAPEVGLMGTSGIVGPVHPPGGGGGYSAKLLKTDRVGVAFFGDGAATTARFTRASTWPHLEAAGAVRVREQPVRHRSAVRTFRRQPDVAARAAGYGMPGVEVDGNDVLAVHQAAGKRCRRPRRGGPTLLECRTYRTRAHAEGMRDAGYRSPEEMVVWKERDPIKLFRARMLADGSVPQAELAAVEAEVIQALAEEAGKFAKASPMPDPATVSEHVYAGNSKLETGSWQTRN